MLTVCILGLNFTTKIKREVIVHWQRNYTTILKTTQNKAYWLGHRHCSGEPVLIAIRIFKVLFTHLQLNMLHKLYTLIIINWPVLYTCNVVF